MIRSVCKHLARPRKMLKLADKDPKLLTVLAYVARFPFDQQAKMFRIFSETRRPRSKALRGVPDQAANSRRYRVPRVEVDRS
jgi:hypothetical protein